MTHKLAESYRHKYVVLPLLLGANVLIGQNSPAGYLIKYVNILVFSLGHTMLYYG